MKKALSKYARVFDNKNPLWSKDYYRNLMFLKTQTVYINDLLKAKRTKFLNEVYDILGFAGTQTGQNVGWHYDLKNPTGDNFIDFQIDGDEVENTITLDFNVDGRVIQYLNE